MKPNQCIQSQHTGRRYTLIRRLGKGGFGEAWEAVPTMGRRKREPVCLKVNRESTPWHRECYFGEILRGYPGVIQMSDEFVAVVKKRPLYCAAFELAEGSVHDRRPDWSAEYAIEQFRPVVEAAAEMHRMGAVHRDITARNVLVTRDNKLVLADYGIALHGAGRPVEADCFNAWYAPDSVFRETAKWEPRDDVWQLGQLLAFLLDREVDGPIETKKVRGLDCPDVAKALIFRCIAPRQHRLQDAGRLLEVMNFQSRPTRRVRRIKGMNIVFTGRGSVPREHLTIVARRAGANVQRHVSHKTDILVCSDASPIWAAGTEGGKKILAALEQQDRGLPIRLMSEVDFLAAARKGR